MRQCWPMSQAILTRDCASEPCTWRRIVRASCFHQAVALNPDLGQAGGRPRHSRAISRRPLRWAIAAEMSPPHSRALGAIAAKDADDPWMRLAILSGLAESSLAFIPLCDAIPSASGRAELQSEAAAIVGCPPATPELAKLLEMIASRTGEETVPIQPHGR